MKQPTLYELGMMERTAQKTGYRWFAKDMDGTIYAYEDKPDKGAYSWIPQETHALNWELVAIDLQFLSFADNEPYYHNYQSGR